MLKSDIHELIANGESSGIKFKEDTIRPEQLAKEIVAMCNFQGGRVLLGVSKPYVLRNEGREDIYIRVGSTSRLATREQQMRLYELGGLLRTESIPVPKSPKEWQIRLQAMGFLTESNGQIYCTVAGLILFGKRPRQFAKLS